MNKINIVYVADADYVPYLKISMESVRRYNKNVKFFVLCKEWLDIEGAGIYTMKPDTSNFKYKPNDRMKETVYYKFWIPALPVDKALYLDCDTICQRPLNDLWNEKCDFICATESHRIGKKQAAQLGVAKYALTGMMLMNLKALRGADFTRKCLERLSIETPNQHDETIINLQFNDRIRFIDKKYNYCRNRTYDYPIPESDAYILHYVGNDKKDMLQRSNFEQIGWLKDYLKGKSVAIVGNARSLLVKEQGREIDSHDVVIRFNKGYPAKKVGFRTDILFLACTLTTEELLKFGTPYTVRRSKLCGNCCDGQISVRDRLQLCQSLTPVARMKAKTHCQPSTGFIAINFALSSDCRSIDLYGFDFFRTSTYYNKPGYVTLHNGAKEEEKILEYEKNGLVLIC